MKQAQIKNGEEKDTVLQIGMSDSPSIIKWDPSFPISQECGIFEIPTEGNTSSLRPPLPTSRIDKQVSRPT